jgi:hypothetical protein
MLTRQDEENYGPEFLDVARRAAVDALAPELQQLRAQNQHLRQMAQRSQRAEIERTLDREVPGWRERIFADPRFAEWLESPDEYSPTSRSQLLRRAVASGDGGRVAAIYKGFEREAHHAPVGHHRGAQSRQAASGNRIYSRDEIKRLYEARRLGQIDDRRWGPLEADIFAAGRESRIAGALSLTDGTEMTRLVR